jgi:hypothetical protein
LASSTRSITQAVARVPQAARLDPRWPWLLGAGLRTQPERERSITPEREKEAHEAIQAIALEARASPAERRTSTLAKRYSEKFTKIARWDKRLAR